MGTFWVWPEGVGECRGVGGSDENFARIKED